ncbi:transport system permease protein [Desulfarculus baarsii DSM 2075]|uniref:Transport system permease protein n=1 Tax=Desulfarculus baarsii (strain ATCC 33931 / DSM 2075 / LMG 7858 / VKM B-1802 / 2st14) TaxID=644282 RepID=E1QJQ7_DESB2|nr:iron ABC transporter permease [Desulfarculus baarsii]ADK85800.1 transport system permease protein [Desulfarculus baarsii DSM 2075]
MRATPVNLAWLCLVLCLLLAATFVLGLTVGTASVPLGQVWDWAMGRADTGSAAVIVGQLRLPRLLVAALAGAALSLSGAVFQGVLRNPLAEPFILGVSGGAATGAVLAISLGLAGLWAVSTFAFLGALGTMLLVMAIAGRRGGLDAASIVLTGVMVNAFFTACIMFVISTTTDQKLHSILFWLYGDLSGATMAQAALLAPVLALAGAALWLRARHLNLLSAGETAAAALGVEVGRTRFFLMIVASLLVGAAVSLSGLIGFVGLMAPHLLRMTIGHDHRLLLPGSVLFGASFLCLADTAARTLISPSSLPVGVVTAALGAPFFLLLLARRGVRWM